jgi:hypothetical protein
MNNSKNTLPSITVMDFDHFSCNFHKRSTYITNIPGAVRPSRGF